MLFTGMIVESEAASSASYSPILEPFFTSLDRGRADTSACTMDPYGPCIFDVAVEHRKEGICPCDVATVAGTEQTIYIFNRIPDASHSW
jgi:hypothetical protein